MNDAGGESPQLELSNQQEAVALDLDRLSDVATRAVPLCLAEVRRDDAALPGLRCVEVSLVSDEQIAAVHGEFLDDPTATDVITFDHGEILVSVDTAAARAPEYGHEVDQEVALYMIHGLLHLAGFGDKSEEEFERMRDLQEKILHAVW